MKIYCSCCDKVQPVRVDDCLDAKTRGLGRDVRTTEEPQMNTMEKSLLAYLSKYPNGVSESILIADMNTYPGRNVRRALSSTFGVYIDRWEWSPLKNDFVPVYRAVEVPPDAKKPGWRHAEQWLEEWDD